MITVAVLSELHPGEISAEIFPFGEIAFFNEQNPAGIIIGTNQFRASVIALKHNITA